MSHKKRLEKQQLREMEQIRSARQAKIIKWLIISVPVSLIIVLVIVGLVAGFSPDKQTAASGGARIEIQPQEYNAGTVSMSDGLVKHTYEIKNTGDSDLKIKKISTSCMCTTAILTVDDKASPKFGMHTNNPLWSEEISPRATGFLEVTFDPAFHGPQGTGQAMRVVYLVTNDPNNSQAELRLQAFVVK